LTTARPWLWIFTLVGLGACAVVPDPPTGGPTGRAGAAAMASLAGTRWIGVVDTSIDSRQLPRLEFVSGGRITGYTGCNMLGGTWSQDGGIVRFGAIAVTKRMCLGPGAEVERRVLAVLGDESRVSREGSKLVIVSPTGERFEFKPAAAA
jgi:heat shock protein HslJ